MPTWRHDWTITVDDGDRQIGFDVPDENGTTGECLVTLDARVWREELGNPAGVRVEVTVTPLDEEEAPGQPVLDIAEVTLTDEQRADAITPGPAEEQP